MVWDLTNTTMHIHSLFNSKKRVRKPKRGVRLLQRPRELGAKRVVERPEEVKAKIKLPKVEGIEEVVVSEEEPLFTPSHNIGFIGVFT